MKPNVNPLCLPENRELIKSHTNLWLHEGTDPRALFTFDRVPHPEVLDSRPFVSQTCTVPVPKS